MVITGATDYKHVYADIGRHGHLFQVTTIYPTYTWRGEPVTAVITIDINSYTALQPERVGRCRQYHLSSGCRKDLFHGAFYFFMFEKPFETQTKSETVSEILCTDEIQMSQSDWTGEPSGVSDGSRVGKGERQAALSQGNTRGQLWVQEDSMLTCICHTIEPKYKATKDNTARSASFYNRRHNHRRNLTRRHRSSSTFSTSRSSGVRS